MLNPWLKSLGLLALDFQNFTGLQFLNYKISPNCSFGITKAISYFTQLKCNLGENDAKMFYDTNYLMNLGLFSQYSNKFQNVDVA